MGVQNISKLLFILCLQVPPFPRASGHDLNGEYMYNHKGYGVDDNKEKNNRQSGDQINHNITGSSERAMQHRKLFDIPLTSQGRTTGSIHNTALVFQEIEDTGNEVHISRL